VYVYERQRWQYHVVMKRDADEPIASDELNALGHDGWELVGIVPVHAALQFVFKRAK